MESIPSLNDDNADEHYDHKATNTNEVGSYNCCITFYIQQLAKCFDAALLRSCKHRQHAMTILQQCSQLMAIDKFISYTKIAQLNVMPNCGLRKEQSR